MPLTSVPGLPLEDFPPRAKELVRRLLKGLRRLDVVVRKPKLRSDRNVLYVDVITKNGRHNASDAILAATTDMASDVQDGTLLYL